MKTQISTWHSPERQAGPG